jgi:hypothetical protein
MRKGLKITFVLCPEKVYKYVVGRHELVSIFIFSPGVGEWMMLFYLL